MNKKSKIVVIGGGTAGWLSALYAQKYTDSEVIVIASDETGVIGAGEGGTPNLITTMLDLDIPLEDLLTGADATIKTGIEFINWDGDGTSYVNEFSPLPEFLDPFNGGEDSLALTAIRKGIPLDALSFARKCSDQRKSPFVKFDNFDNITNFKKYGGWGFHINSIRLIEVLRKHASARSIKHINAHVKGFKNDENGNINEIIFNSGVSMTGVDFLIDCSGFARIALGKHYNAEWVDCSDYLPLKQTVPFFMERDDQVKSMTEAVAMSSGWAFRIPLSGRFGCGYTYDSDYIDRDTAIKEIYSTFKEIKSVADRTISFNVGYIKQSLIKNCLGVGLSQSFFEPIEATTIWAQCITLKDFFEHQLWEPHQAQDKIDGFNSRVIKRLQAIGDFIHMHYLTSRKDTPFWAEFRDKYPTPDRIKEVIKIIATDPTKFTSFHGETGLWDWGSVARVVYGVGDLRIKQHKTPDELYDDAIIEFINLQQQISNQCMQNVDFFELFTKHNLTK